MVWYICKCNHLVYKELGGVTMAKSIKYQLATEIPRNVVVKVPLLDEDGNPVIDEITNNPVFVDEIQEEIEVVFSQKTLVCKTQEIFDASMPIAQAEAYNGEITVDGELDPEPVTEPTADEVLNALLGVTV